MTHRIAIIGGGPKGVYGLERLAAQLAHSPLEQPVEIHIFNRTAAFGAGEIYDPDQPDYLRLNFCAGMVDLWSAEDPPPVVPEPLPFTTWCRRRGLQVSDEDYPPRALVGRYLADGFDAILGHLPAGVGVVQHVGEVTDLQPGASGYHLAWAAGGKVVKIRRPFHKILLATGHPRRRPTATDRALAEHARYRPGAVFIPSIYPTESTLASVRPGSIVGIKGMTLTFVDAVLALTEGRGGTFYRDGGGGLRYRRSGEEPATVFAFSRSGLPAVPKAADVARHRHRLRFVTAEVLTARRDAAPDGRLDFERDIWPLVEAEMRFAFHQVHARRAVEDPESSRSSAPRLDLQALLDPIGTRTFSGLAECREFGLDYLRRELAKARRGDAGCAEKAAIDVWRDAREVFLPFLACGGLTPASHRELRDRTWPLMKRLVFGPPLASMEKILALAEEGLLDLSAGPGATVQPCARSGRFLIRGPRVAGARILVDTLIDARIPKMSLSLDASPLYLNLKLRGLVRAFENSRSGDLPYRPGALAVSPEDGFVIGRDREPNPDLTAIGIPTEGNLFGNESLSRKKNPYAEVWARNVTAQLQHRERRQEVAA